MDEETIDFIETLDHVLFTQERRREKTVSKPVKLPIFRGDIVVFCKFKRYKACANG